MAVPSFAGHQPASHVDDVYSLSPVRVGPFINAVAAQYDIGTIELNQDNSGYATDISDPGAGQYTAQHWRVEGRVSASGAAQSYFNAPNGLVSINYLEEISINVQSGGSVYVINQGANLVAYAKMNFAQTSLLGSGSFFRSNTGTRTIFHCLFSNLAFGPQYGMCNISASAACDFTILEDGSMSSDLTCAPDANFTATSTTPRTVAFSSLTAARTLALPSAYDNGLFSGKMICVENDSPTYAATVTGASAAETVAPGSTT